MTGCINIGYNHAKEVCLTSSRKKFRTCFGAESLVFRALYMVTKMLGLHSGY